MPRLSQTISLVASCKIIGKVQNIFVPIREAVINAFDSITQRLQIDNSFVPSISLSVYLTTNKDLYENLSYSLSHISVQENGIGFTTDNVERFKTLGENSKGLNNRGTGKIRIFCLFDELSIDSTYIEEGTEKTYVATYKKSNEFIEDRPQRPTQNQNTTTITLSHFSGDSKGNDFFVRYLENFEELKSDILKHFLLRLWISSVNHNLDFTIRLFLDKKLRNEFIFNRSTIPSPDKTESIEIYSEHASIPQGNQGKHKIKINWIETHPKFTLNINRFKLPVDQLEENGIYLCSKNIIVDEFKYKPIQKSNDYSGYRYLACISGDLFDDPENVRDTVDGFTFENRKSIEANLNDSKYYIFNDNNTFVFWETIKEKIEDGLRALYSDLSNIQEQHNDRVAGLARQYGISADDIEKATDISINDTDTEITKKLFKSQAMRLATENIEIFQTYHDLKELHINQLDPTSKEFNHRLFQLTDKLLKTIPSLNKDELTRYIIRRAMVVELLKQALRQELAIQRKWLESGKNSRKQTRSKSEAVIHDLIFKRHTKGTPNDLWILNEEFVHYDGCSNYDLNQITIRGEKLLRSDVDIKYALKKIGIPDTQSPLEWQPDIFLYPEEGKCILIEFKAPDAEVSKYCDQIQKYAKVIANYSVKSYTNFFGFLIGELINEASIPGRYRKAPYGNYWIYPSEDINDLETSAVRGNLYQEIIPLSEIAKRAEIRNRSFAERLGISHQSEILLDDLFSVPE